MRETHGAHRRMWESARAGSNRRMPGAPCQGTGAWRLRVARWQLHEKPDAGSESKGERRVIICTACACQAASRARCAQARNSAVAGCIKQRAVGVKHADARNCGAANGTSRSRPAHSTKGAQSSRGAAARVDEARMPEWQEVDWVHGSECGPRPPRPLLGGARGWPTCHWRSRPNAKLGLYGLFMGIPWARRALPRAAHLL